jgi:GPH family glycoside/pentoside/hexuronide:cation symporter/probable glucitol transport protein GutA
MFGAIAERTRSKHGRFRPYILWGSPLLAIFGVIAFTSPFGGSGPGKIIFAAITYNIVAMIYTAVNISYSALAGVITVDPKERTELFSWRMMGASSGGVLINAITVPIIVFFNGVDDGKSLTQRGYVLCMIVFGIISTSLFILLFLSTKEVVKPAARSEKVPIRQSFKELVTNWPFVLVFFIVLFLLMGMFGRIGLTVYYVIYVVKRFDLIPVFMMLPSLCMVISIAITKSFADKIGKKKLGLIGYISSSLCTILIFFVNPANIPLILALTVGYGLGMFTTPISLSFLAETIDYGEDKTGNRADGIAYAASSISVKFGNALGPAIALFIMGAFGYVPNAEQSAQSIAGINFAANVLPGIFILLAAIPMLLYPLTPEKNQEIRKRLEEKKQAVNRQ